MDAAGPSTSFLFPQQPQDAQTGSESQQQQGLDAYANFSQPQQPQHLQAPCSQQQQAHGLSSSAGVSASPAAPRANEGIYIDWKKLTAAPELTFTHDAELSSDLFETVSQAYTPSYNSIGDFGSSTSDHDFGLDAGGDGSWTYDPETADSYSQIPQAILVSQPQDPAKTSLLASPFTPADATQFRDPQPGVIVSPVASPQLLAQPPSHLRAPSFGNEAQQGQIADQNQQAWLQSLGQRININDDEQQQQTQHQPAFAPVFEEDDAQNLALPPSLAQTQQASSSQSGASQASAFASSGQINPAIPVLSVSGDSSVSDVPMRSMSKEFGFSLSQSLLASPGMASRPLEGADYGEGKDAYSQNGGEAKTGQEQQQQGPTSGAGRSGQAAIYAAQAGRGQLGAAHLQSTPARQDSYDKVRRFLKLDVDMGFLPSTGARIESPTSAMRRRSNSDLGPRSPTEAEGGAATSSAGLLAAAPGLVTDKTPTAATAGIDWVVEAAKQREARINASGPGPVGAPLRYPPSRSGTLTMDPHMLDVGPTEPGPSDSAGPATSNAGHYDMGIGPSQSPASDVGPIRRDARAPSVSSSSSPYAPAMNFHARSQSSGNNQRPDMSGVDLVGDLLGPEDYRRGSAPSHGRSPRATHRRGAASEDLSKMARAADPSQFLNRITAPDGGLAPPSFGGGPQMMSGAGMYAGIGQGSARAHPYRGPGMPWTGNSAEQPFFYPPVSNVVGPADYVPTALPKYGAYSPATSHKLQAMHGSSPERPMPAVSAAAAINAGLINVPVATVTTSATQAASASRRKNQAVHICPVPGCGSTFTRAFNLQGHIRSHTGQKPFKCDHPGCTKAFARSFDLSRHQRLHSDNKPYRCECGKQFARADALARHQKTDSGLCSRQLGSDGGADHSASPDGDDGKEYDIGPGAYTHGAGGSGHHQQQPQHHYQDFGGISAHPEAHGIPASSSRFGGHVL